MGGHAERKMLARKSKEKRYFE